jgi:hypothetical protein
MFLAAMRFCGRLPSPNDAASILLHKKWLAKHVAAIKVGQKT